MRSLSGSCLLTQIEDSKKDKNHTNFETDMS